MPTTTRLLTDETGQALVTAINNIVAAVKPNATEIQMSSSDTTTVATAITNINDKIGTVPSGQTVEGQITTLNGNIANIVNPQNLGSQTTIDELKTAITNAVSNVTNGATVPITFRFDAAIEPFSRRRVYEGTLYKHSATIWSGVFTPSDHIPVYIANTNGTWIIEGIALNSNIAGMKIEKYEGILSMEDATNIFATGITWTNYAIVGIVIGNFARSVQSDGMTYYKLAKDGTLTIGKASAEWGGTTKIYVTVIHN